MTSEPFEAFLEYLHFEKRYSEHTLTAYRTDLQQFYTFLEEDFEITDATAVTHVMVRTWIAQMMEADASARSVNRKLSTLKSYYKYLRKMGEITENPMAKVVGPKTRKKLPVYVEEDPMKELLNGDLFSDDFEGTRDKMIIELFYATGARLSELINLRETDITFTHVYKGQNKMQVAQTNGTIKVLGKRNKERLIPFGNQLASSLKNYQSKKLEAVGSSPELLVTATGKKLSRQFVYRCVNHYLGKVTTLKKTSPHVLRHTFATHMLNNGADLNAIKELLGHANLAATQVYTHNTIDQLKQIHKQAHPKG